MSNEVTAPEAAAGPAGDELCLNTLRFLAVDAVERAASGHPGMPMGDAAMAYTLWTRFLRFSPGDPRWPDRDRFVLSAGHGSMLLYGLLHLSGFDITLDDLRSFRQWGSPTPGHPEYDPDRGIEMTTGPLGQGFATGVGMAMAARYLGDRYNRPGYTLFDYNVYAVTSDGDLMEGVSSEAASLAGHLALGNVVYLYSDNRITIEGPTDLTFTEDVAARFRAMKWHVQQVDGDDIEAVSAAIEAARAEKSRPSLIMARTHIGFGSPAKQDTAGAHGAPLGPDEARAAKRSLGWPEESDFYVPDEARRVFEAAARRGSSLAADWRALFERYRRDFPGEAAELEALMAGRLPGAWEDRLPAFKPSDGPMATRSASGRCLNAMAGEAPFLVGGSADLGPSNNTFLKGFESFAPGASGRNIHFGVREHAMGAVMNGMALDGLIVPYGGTFLVFSDYMRPAIRLACLMKTHVVYVFTHDSIGLGEDGPTHQPVEHLAALRAVPGMTVIRPADAEETKEAWRTALRDVKGPVALVLTRQKVPLIDRTRYAGAEGVRRGAYVLADCAAEPELIIIATGSEVHIAIEACEALADEGVRVRLVNMASRELFERQDPAYRESVLPRNVRRRLAVEAASSFGWGEYVGLDGAAISIDRFGASAPAPTLFEKFGFTAENIKTQALRLLGKS
ncbi:MAG TPA: transketolase [Deltaproteobacteria bacterium]|nr:transketolase [Deltaproteobacteria bacterium]